MMKVEKHKFFFLFQTVTIGAAAIDILGDRDQVELFWLHGYLAWRFSLRPEIRLPFFLWLRRISSHGENSDRPAEALRFQPRNCMKRGERRNISSHEVTFYGFVASINPLRLTSFHFATAFCRKHKSTTVSSSIKL